MNYHTNDILGTGLTENVIHAFNISKYCMVMTSDVSNTFKLVNWNPIRNSLAKIGIPSGSVLGSVSMMYNDIYLAVPDEATMVG